VISDTTSVDSFVEWARTTEPRLRQAFTALLGVDGGLDATADALMLAWERWPEVSAMENPAGYVYTAARNLSRRRSRRMVPFTPVPELPSALARLSEQQRIVVVLLHGYEWTMSEVAELLGVSKSTIQNHAERGLAALQKRLGVHV
jgi:DNA-directed RNA polymerase specialized sigma24 family protein